MQIKRNDYIRLSGDIKKIYEYLLQPKFKLDNYSVCQVLMLGTGRIAKVESVRNGLVYSTLTSPFDIGLPMEFICKSIPPMNKLDFGVTKTEELVLELEKRGYKVKISN